MTAALSSRTPTPDRDRRTDDGRSTILFVDDDEHVLNGLRAVLRRRLRNCRMLFTPNPQEALALLDSTPVDMVVADLQMPVLNGVELLDLVRHRHPDALRYLLSGEAELEMLLDAVPVAHRWINKPCNSDDLAHSLNRALVHRQLDLTTDAEARRALAAGGSLPSPPELYHELTTMLSNPDASLDDVADRIASDPAVSAKLLQWANSAAIGREPVRDTRRAVARAGLDNVAKLALSAEVFRAFRPDEIIPGFSIDRFTHYCSTASRLAAQLARPEDAVDASLAALLGPIGLLLEASHLPDRLQRSYEHALEHDITLAEAELQLHGICHLALGVHLLSVWGLPSDLVSLVAVSYEPLRVTSSAPPLDVADAVRAARLLALDDPESQPIGDPHRDRLDPTVRAVLADWRDTMSDLAGENR